MAFDIKGKLVVAVTSTALFDLRAADRVYRKHGLEAYRKYQRKREKRPLATGDAFPFVKRLLSLNNLNSASPPIEVILLSHNNSDTGLRVFNSIEGRRLPISRAAFLSGEPPHRYIEAFNASLFLSKSAKDVKEAVMRGHPAGQILDSAKKDLPKDREFRIAFDFDGILADDASERVFAQRGLRGFFNKEKRSGKKPMRPGPLLRLLVKIAELQRLEVAMSNRRRGYVPRIKVAIMTSRNAPAHRRVVTSLRKWGVTVNSVFFLGGMDKGPVLSVFKPHIFLDDQMQHAASAAHVVPSVHVPFGVRNTADPNKIRSGSRARRKAERRSKKSDK